METAAFKCINCDAPLQFDPQKQKFTCEFCLSEFTEQELSDYFSKIDKKLDQEHKKEPTPVSEDEFASEAGIYVCQGCGAEVIADKNTAATFCVYCHSPVMLSNRMAGQFRPDQVIPFKISEEDAKKRFHDFCSKKIFLPKDFLSSAQLDMMKGVYYPYWFIDSAKAGRVYGTAENTRTWEEGDYEYTETLTYAFERRGSIDFTDYPHTALKKDDNLTALKYVNPYDEGEFKPFTMSYLSGFLAEKRDTERPELQEAVDHELMDYAEKYLRKEISADYDKIKIEGLDFKTREESWHYALLPVWLMTFTYNGQQYLYAMNGQTGKNYGELPLDKKKLTAFSIGLFVLLLLVCLLGGYLLG